MVIFLNNQPLDISSEKTLFGFLKEKGMCEKKGIAVAVNNEVVSKASWRNYNLKNSDKITLITATQGG